MFEGQEEDTIYVAYVYKEDESVITEIIQEHDCFEGCEIEHFGNLRLIDVAIADDVIERFNEASENGTQNGRGFNRSKKGCKKLKFCFSTAFQGVSEEEALSWV